MLAATKRSSMHWADAVLNPANRASNPSIERPFQRPHRDLWPAAHVER